MNKVFSLLSLLGTGLLVTGCVETDRPLDALKRRIVHAGQTGNDMNADVQATLRCPTGMKPAENSHRVALENDTRFEYREESPGQSFGRSRRGAIYGDYSTHSSHDVEVEAETNTYSTGRLTCVPDIRLHAERR